MNHEELPKLPRLYCPAISTTPMRRFTLMFFLAFLATFSFANGIENQLLRERLEGASAQAFSLCIPVIDRMEVPTLDGIIDENEWANAARVTGFCFHPADQGMADTESGEAYITTDGEWLYLAVKTSTPNMDPGGGLSSFATQRDGAVYDDDSVEIMFCSPDDEDIVCHCIVNSIGTVFDRKAWVSTNEKDVGFNLHDIKIGSLAQSGYWHLEMAFSLRELNVRGHKLKLNIARNWNGIGPSQLVATDNHLNTTRMISLAWSPHYPVCRMNGIGCSTDGLYEISLNMNRLPKDGHYAAAGCIIEKSYPVIDGKVVPQERIVAEAETSFKGNETLELRHGTTKNHIHLVKLVVVNTDTGEVIFRRAFNGRKNPKSSGRFLNTLQFETAFGSGFARYYPGYNRIRIETRSTSKDAPLLWHCVGPENFQADFETRRRGPWSEVLAQLPETAGTYSFHVFVPGTSPDLSHADFSIEKKNSPWEHNSLGLSPRILSPFTPIGIQGAQASFLLRSLTLNACGLPESIQAKEAEILTEPARFDLVADGAPVVLSGNAPEWKTLDGGASAIAETTAFADGIELATHSTLDYDGFLWNHVTLKNPSGKDIEKLTLVLTLPEHIAKLFHATPDGIRSNPAGAIPPGKGVVWDGSELKRMVVFGKMNLHPQFVPYVWLGEDEKGLCFLMSSSYGTCLAEDKPAIRIIRQDDGRVSLEVDFINQSARETERTFDFGLMPTPVKPLNPALRSCHVDQLGMQIPGMKTVFSMDCQLSGLVENWSKFPWENDYALMDATTNLISTAQGMQEFEKTFADWRSKYDEYFQRRFSQLVAMNPRQNHWEYWLEGRESEESIMRNAVKSGAPMYVSLYSDPRLFTNIDETAMYFSSEWGVEPLGYVTSYRSMLTPSYLDYIVTAYHGLLKHGVFCVYLDDMFIIPDVNPDTQARRDSRGFVHAETGLLAMRQLVRRIATMQEELGMTPRYLCVHMTNALLIPVFSLATVQLDWEIFFGERWYDDRFTPEYLRATSAGTQLGALPLVLTGSNRRTTSVEDWRGGFFQKLCRSQFSMTLPHWIYIWCRRERPFEAMDPEMQQKICTIMAQFGCHLPDTKFVPYYSGQREISVDHDEHILLSYWDRGKKKLAVVSNPTAEAKNVTVAFAGTRPVDIIDAETGLPASPEDLEIPPHDFRLLELQF